MLEPYPLRIGGVRRESPFRDGRKRSRVDRALHRHSERRAVRPEFLAINPKVVVSVLVADRGGKAMKLTRRRIAVTSDQPQKTCTGERS